MAAFIFVAGSWQATRLSSDQAMSVTQQVESSAAAAREASQDAALIEPRCRPVGPRSGRRASIVGSAALLDPFLAEPSPARRVAFGPAARPPILSLKARTACWRTWRADIARLDAAALRKVNAILHHPRFQRLEASWRGLYFLAEQADGAEGVKVRVLSSIVEGARPRPQPGDRIRPEPVVH